MSRRAAQGHSSKGIAAFLRRVGVAVVALLATFYGICTLLLAVYAFMFPPLTSVQVQRRVEALFDEEPYEKRYAPVPPAQISNTLAHAVVAAEDTRFYQHHGIDWKAVREAFEVNLARDAIIRGGSTITQQLIKNLFLTTHTSFLRKALEVPLAYLAELILSKDRLLTLYLNVIEWGRGIYGAEAAARHYYGRSAAALSRYQAAALAAIIPNPRERSPRTTDWYTQIILGRMSNLYPAGAPPRRAPSNAPSVPAPDSAATDSMRRVRPAPIPAESIQALPPAQNPAAADSTTLSVE